MTRATWLMTVLFVPSVVPAATLDGTMDELAFEISRRLRRFDAESVAVDPVDAPFPDGAAAAVRNAFVAALANRSVAVSSKPADVAIALSYERGPADGRYVFRARVKDAENEVLGEFTKEVVLDDAVDRTILEGLSYDATTLPDGSPRVATRVEIGNALAEGGVTAVESDLAVADAADPPIIVEVGPDGRITVVTGEARIVVDPQRPEFQTSRDFRLDRPGEDFPMRGSRWERYCPKPSHRRVRRDR